MMPTGAVPSVSIARREPGLFRRVSGIYQRSQAFLLVTRQTC
jgi:hypothetical protein